MAKKIVFSRKAFADIDRIIEFNNLRNKSDSYSKKFVRKLNKQVKILGKHPLIGLVTDEPDELLFIWDNYYIFYVNIESAIQITSVYHQKEDVVR